MTPLIRRALPTSPVLPLAIGFIVLAIISAASVFLVDRFEDDAGLVAHTLEVDTQLSGLQLLLRRSESAQRGYLLTSDDSYRVSYESAKGAIGPALALLRSAVSDNRVELENLSRLEPIIREKLAEMDETIRLHRSGNAEAAVALVRTDKGRLLMSSALGVMVRMRAEENGLLTRRRANSQHTSRMLLGVNLAGALSIVLLAALAIALMRRSTGALRQAQRALTEANEGLEAIVAERTADLREANEEIQRFAYIVSHDLRAPLVNIMGYTAELEALRGDLFERLDALRQTAADADDNKEKMLGGDFDEALGFIKSSISKMDRLINAILKLSREGRRDFRPERVDMGAMIESIRKSLAHQAAEAGAEIVISPLPPVTSDRLALEQIFSNLIDNALKYLRAGVPGRIEVGGRVTPAGLVYEVRDNGRGIDVRDRERVFELFRRAGAQDRPGEGIGLAHVRTLVRRLGGSIGVTSQPGEGSTFTVTLPRVWTGERQEERKAA